MFELIARFFRWIKSWFSRVESETETVAEDVAFTESKKLTESTEKLIAAIVAPEPEAADPVEVPVSEPEATPEAPAAEAPVSEAVAPVETSVPVEAPAATTVTDPVEPEATTESAT